MNIPIYRILLDEGQHVNEKSYSYHVSVFRMTGPYTFDTLFRTEYDLSLGKPLIFKLVKSQIRQLRKSMKWPFIKRNMT